jgi:hypothetical protein
MPSPLSHQYLHLENSTQSTVSFLSSLNDRPTSTWNSSFRMFNRVSGSCKTATAYKRILCWQQSHVQSNPFIGGNIAIGAPSNQIIGGGMSHLSHWDRRHWNQLYKRAFPRIQLLRNDECKTVPQKNIVVHCLRGNWQWSLARQSALSMCFVNGLQPGSISDRTCMHAPPIRLSLIELLI